MDAIDTNILVYSFDLAYLEKRKICSKILTEVFEGKKKAAVTNQILAEFVVAVTQKIERPLPKDKAIHILGAILSSSNWLVLNYTGNSVLNAANNFGTHFWDSLIAETLKENGVQTIITENVKDFAGLNIRADNPFK